MSCLDKTKDPMNESSDHTDNAGDLSNEQVDIASLNIGTVEHSEILINDDFKNLNACVDDVQLSFFPINVSPTADERTRSQSSPLRPTTEEKWPYSSFRVESPPKDEESNAVSFFGSKETPSLNIVCSDFPSYSPHDDRRLLDSPLAVPQTTYWNSPPLQVTTRVPERMNGEYNSTRPISYFPISPRLGEENTFAYPKMGSAPSSAFSPRSAGGGGYGGGGYSSSFYEPMPMSSPSARTPVINRRFMEPIDGYIYQVQFKRAHKNYILAPSAPRNIIPGDFVKVEADRGEDMGIVLSKSPANEFEEVIPTAGYRGRGFSSGQGERKFLFRLANAEERAALTEKVIDEERALEVIRLKVVEQCLPMTILDAEYQFDRHKLTFFFEADRRIDFRELVSDLFSLYKTRIWMQQVDTSALAYNDAGAELAKATGFLPQRDDSAYMQMSHLTRTDKTVVGGEGMYPQLSQYGSPRAASFPSRYPQFSTQPLTDDATLWARGVNVEQDPSLGLGPSNLINNTELSMDYVSSPRTGAKIGPNSTGSLWDSAHCAGSARTPRRFQSPSAKPSLSMPMVSPEALRQQQAPMLYSPQQQQQPGYYPTQTYPIEEEPLPLYQSHYQSSYEQTLGEQLGPYQQIDYAELSLADTLRLDSDYSTSTTTASKREKTQSALNPSAQPWQGSWMTRKQAEDSGRTTKDNEGSDTSTDGKLSSAEGGGGYKVDSPQSSTEGTNTDETTSSVVQQQAAGSGGGAEGTEVNADNVTEQLFSFATLF